MGNKFDTIFLKRESDSIDIEHLKFKRLFDSLVSKYSIESLLKYLEDKTDIAPYTVLGWLRGDSLPSSGIRQNIFKALNYLRPEDLPMSILQPIKINPKEAVTIPELGVNLKEKIIKPKKVKLNKFSTRKEDEAEGRYEGLNLYESDLLDYLKDAFAGLEFNIRDIKFEEKRVRGNRYMHQHLSYLTVLGYLKGPFTKDGRFYYKVIK